MKTLFLIILHTFFIFQSMAQIDYSRQWEKVDSLQNIGQFKTALDGVMEIYKNSKANNLSDQQIKALIYKIRLESAFEEKSHESSISFTEDELHTAQIPVKQILYSILAQIYWDYYTNNRWKIDERTPVPGNQSTDISTWDASRFAEVCSNYFNLSVSEAEVLKKTSLSRFEVILEGEKDLRKLRPTLFDFLVFRAIDFFSGERAGVTLPSDGFSLNDVKYFSPASEFVRLNISSNNHQSFDLQAIKLYQEVLRFHLSDQTDASEALIDADLARLSFIKGKSNLPDKEKLYENALRTLGNNYKSQEVSAEINYQLAVHLKTQGEKYDPLVSDKHKWDIKEAFEIAERTAGKFSETNGGRNCKNLIYNIKLPSLHTTANYAVIPRQPSLMLIEYKNVKTAFFRLIKIDPKEGRDAELNDYAKIPEKYLSETALQNWSLELPSDEDFQRHSAEIKIPALDPGFYILLTSVTSEFRTDSLITWSKFWSTGISLLSQRNNDGQNELLLLDRKNGQPLTGVKVQPFYRQWDYDQRRTTGKPGQVQITDANGFVLLNTDTNQKNNLFYLVLTSAADKFITESYFSGYRIENEPKTEIRVHFFTDRAIYRPGQTIYFKGIATEHSGNQPKLKTNFKTIVKFYDVNMQELSSLEVTTNEFGSFSGSFVTPQECLTGDMTISNEHGSKSVKVEEYKRPKFEITFLPVKGSYKLGQEIVVEGKAMAYSGNNVTDGAVTYRVVRNAHFPSVRWNWQSIFPSSPEMEITNGKTTTGNNGEFTIRFNAIPDLSVEEKFSPVFTYTIYADVTDLNGETHCTETEVSAGYQTLLINTNIPDEVNAENGINFSMKTTNLNGEPEKTTGSISIHKIIQPAAVLFPRKWKRPDKFIMTRYEFKKTFPGEVYDNEDDITNWSGRELVYSGLFIAPADSNISALSNPQPGLYFLEIKTKDIFDKEVVYGKYFTVFSPTAAKAATISPAFVSLMKSKAEPGEVVPLLFASPLNKVHAIVKITSPDGKTKRSLYTTNNQQIRIDLPVEESQRGNIAITVIFVKNNRVFQVDKLIEVPYSNKELDIATRSFRNKLEPGQQEEWQFTIRDKKGEKAVAEMVAAMYDASLDAFVPNDWDFSLYSYIYSAPGWNSNTAFNLVRGNTAWYPNFRYVEFSKNYERIIDFGFRTLFTYQKSAMMVRGTGKMADKEMMILASEAVQYEQRSDDISVENRAFLFKKQQPVILQKSQPSLPVKSRKDFNETAFFFPHLATNANGEIILGFRIPESLTRWRMMGLAHTRDLKTGMIEKSLITQKDLMVFPNPPRFLREGDKMQFPVKISNVSENELSGIAELHFFNALTMKPVDSLMKLSPAIKKFVAVKGGSTVTNWEINVPVGLQAVVYRITATSGTFSDGEESLLPVLTNRILVTESLPLPVRAKSVKTFRFEKLMETEKAGITLRNYKLTLEYTSNPAWYAVQALPYLAEFPHECAEQLFSRYYANTIASHIADSDPKIRQIFEAWKTISPNALKSNLEKNEELKNILLQESPWVREAANESERKQRIAHLFDLNRMALEQKTALQKLTEMQTSNGGWPWFPGMPESEYITRHIVAGMGHLLHLGAINPGNRNQLSEILGKAIAFIDAEKLKSFKETKKHDPDYLKNNHLGYDDIHYFYARTLLLDDYPFGETLKELVVYYKSQMTRYWLKSNNYMKAMTALSMYRLGEKNTAALIMRSLSETALHSEELGMYWRNDQRGWYWFQAPVETQALLIEAFEEVLDDIKSVDELKIWLLKQKQTEDWKTTKATTEAIYALLLRGTSLLSSDNQATITMGGIQVNPYSSDSTKPEPGTGYFKTSWDAATIKPEMGKLRIDNPNQNIAWGALYWQYFEQLDKITPAKTPLKLSKNLFVETNSPAGPVLKAITDANPIKVGDKVVVRIILDADRDMEYIHLKDLRAAALEPVNVLSGYRWRDGLGYYESTRDAATNFFIHYLPKGTYVFEYKLNAVQKGDFSSGITTIQCMYSPEFSAHSEGNRVKVE